MNAPARKDKGNAAHNLSGKIVGYAYCKRCGLVTLKNEATRKALKAPCPDDRRV